MPSPRADEIRDRIAGLASRPIRRVVLPEAALDARYLRAAAEVARLGLAIPVLGGARADLERLAHAERVDIDGIDHLEPGAEPELALRLAAAMKARRSAVRGGVSSDPGEPPSAETLSREIAALTADPLLFASVALSEGLFDGLLAGAVSTTATVLRAALRGIGLLPGVRTASSMFLMVAPDITFGDRGAMVFTDCAIVMEPTAEQLAEIAISAADMGAHLAGLTPRIAMLSFSTRGSASHPSVTKMREAARLVAERRPDLAVDGEMQADAALVPAIAGRKAPDSVVAGRANVLVFPDLNAANIGYKLVQRLAGAEAIGPVAQGFARPVNDLSRGCSWNDVADMIVVTAAQANQSA